MTDYPQSPYGQARQAVAELGEGRLSSLQFLTRLDGLGRQLDSWRGQLDSVRLDAGYPEAQELVDDARESLQAICDGIELLREYAGSRCPETAAEALELMSEASDFLAQLLGITEKNMEELENQG